MLDCCASVPHFSVSSSSRDLSSQSEVAHLTTDSGDNLVHREGEYRISSNRTPRFYFSSAKFFSLGSKQNWVVHSLDGSSSHS